MKGIDEMQFTCEADRDGKFVGRVAEFPKLHSKPRVNRLDALDEIIALTAEHAREISCSQLMGAKGTQP